MVRLQTILGFAALLLAAACPSSECRSPRDCGAAQRCVNLACRASSETPGKVGDSCASANECGAGLTCDTSSAFPNGVCTESCASTACASGACATVAGQPTCAATCSSDANCRIGYGCCATLGNVCLPPSLCIPAACERPIATSALPAVQVLAHGSHKVGDIVPFNVPAGTGSITIVHQAQVANLEVVYQNQTIGNSAVPGFITKPDGSRAYDDNNPAFSPSADADGGTDPSGIYSYFGGDTPSTGAFTFPNTQASLTAGVPAGSWNFQVNDYAYECATGTSCNDGGTTGNTYDVTVMARPGPKATGTMNVAFYIVADTTIPATSQPLNASTAPNDPSVQRMVSTFQGIYANAGITVPQPVFYDVPPAARARFGTNISADKTGPCDELNQMFVLSAAHPGNTLNLFLVDSIKQSSTPSGGGTVVGIDGTIPGPSTFMGTVHSGAAVSLADLFAGGCTPGVVSISGCGADAVAFIAAHEAGHFLGMFHTTELDGRYFDTLTDTAKCPCNLCASSTDKAKCATGPTSSSSYFIAATQCNNPGAGCGGGDNLMFWQLQGAVSKGNISNQQGAVMRLNPVVQ